MKNISSYVGLAISIVLFITVVPYSIYEWFDDRLPYNPVFYLFSIISIILLAYNIYSFRKKD